MAIEIVMPRLGWTMEEGVFGEWLKQDGDEVKSGDLLFSVESDKATQEVESFESGILRIPPDAPAPGDVVPVGGLMAYVVAPGEAAPFEQQPVVLSAVAPPPQSFAAQIATVTQSSSASHSHEKTDHILTRQDTGPAISPRARRVAAELGVDWVGLAGSGRTGRIVERDVRAAWVDSAGEASKVHVSPIARRIADAEGVNLDELASQKPGQRIERRDVEAAIAARSPRQTFAASAPSGSSIPVTRVRRLIAQRLAESAGATVPVTLTREVDATELVALREQIKSSFTPRDLPVPTYNDLLIKLTATALQEHPLLTATWRGEDIFLPADIHIGMAVDAEEGLMVPVVRSVPAKSVRQIAAETRELVEQVRTHQLSPDALQGGVFTITNLGAFGVEAFTPIINLPQCAILGVGRIVKKPAVVDDQVVPRQLMMLSLTFDHRVVDGAPAARFLNMLSEYVEEPALWLIG